MLALDAFLNLQVPALPWKEESRNFKSALCQVSWIFSAPCYCTSPLQKERTHPRYLTRQMSYDSSFLYHGHSVSIAFSGSLSHTTDSPLPPPILLYSVVALNTTIPFEKLFHGSYFIRTFLPLASPYVHVPRESWLRYPWISMRYHKRCCKNFRVKIFS